MSIQKLIEKLIKHGIIFSENDADILASFDSEKMILLFNFLDVGFIRQDNFTCVIRQISKMNLSVAIDEFALKNLFYRNLPEINDRILEVLLNELVNNSNSGIFNVGQLLEIARLNHQFLLLPQVIDVISNPQLRELDLTKAVLDSYSYILADSMTKFPDPKRATVAQIITKLNQIILNDTILSSFRSCEDVQKRRNLYHQMLLVFASLCDEMTVFNSSYEMLVQLAMDNKLNVNNIDILFDEVLVSKDKKEVDKCIGVLENSNIKDGTKLNYQRKIGEKKN